MKTFLMDGYTITLEAGTDHNGDPWYTASAENITASSHRPERAVKLAFYRMATRNMHWDNGLCAVCSRSLGDDIECYDRGCDARVLAMIPMNEGDQPDGLYGKYIVLKRNRQPVKGQLFVLKLDYDIHARRAIEAYAASLRMEDPESRLASDLTRWVNDLNRRMPINPD